MLQRFPVTHMGLPLPPTWMNRLVEEHLQHSPGPQRLTVQGRAQATNL